MDEECSSENCENKPLQGYKKLIQSQVRRLRRRVVQQTRLAPLSLSTERGVRELFDGNLALEGQDNQSVWKQERKGDPNTSTVSTKHDIGREGQREAAVDRHDEGMIVGDPGEMHVAYGEHASPGSSELTRTIAEKQTPSTERRLGVDKSRNEDPSLTGPLPRRGQLVAGAVEEPSSDDEAYRFSWSSDEGVKFQNFDQPTTGQEDSTDMGRFSTREVQTEDESSNKTQRVGVPDEIHGLENSGTRSNEQHDVMVEIEDPLTTDLILAEQGQLFHAGEARMRHKLCRSDRPDWNDGDPDCGNAMISTTHQVKVAVCQRTVTEISTNTVIAVNSNLLPANKECPSVVNASFCLSQSANHMLSDEDHRVGKIRVVDRRDKIRRVKVVQFADEMGKPLCSDSGVVHQERLKGQGPSKSIHQASVKIERAYLDQTSEGLGKNEKVRRESSDEESKLDSLSTEVRIPSVQTREVHVDDDSVNMELRERKRYKAGQTSPKPSLEIKDSRGKSEDSTLQPVSAVSLPSKQKPLPSHDINDHTSWQSQSVSPLGCEEVVENRVTKDETLFGADALIQVKPTPVEGMDLDGTSYIDKDIVEARRTFPSISTQTSALMVNCDSAPRAAPLELRETGTSAQSKSRGCIFIYQFIRVCIIVLFIIVIAQLMALCLAVGFVTECDKYNIIFSPIWGFPWVQVDMSSLAVVLKQNLHLINFKPPPT
ncbi:uncharacterized protein LOC119742837 [Patiria miniata]|uniref:Uncharacterized protein n=1 Tax=Patiria miniata TaxID=46514 RepID=A0A914BFV2_PATMI|nr:uncharacterized protein LOC119742837 [Patiria miniata]